MEATNREYLIFRDELTQKIENVIALKLCGKNILIMSNILKQAIDIENEFSNAMIGKYQKFAYDLIDRKHGITKMLDILLRIYVYNNTNH